METPVSTVALVISVTTPDGPAASPNFIMEMFFLTISLVMGIGGRSSVA